MSTVLEQMTAANTETVATTVALAGIAATTAEKVMDLNIGIIKTVFASATENGKAIADAKDAQSISAIQAQWAQPSLETITAYMKDSYDILSESQADLTKIVESRIAEANKTIVSTLDQAEKNAPAGSDVAVSAMKSAVAAANQAFDAFAKAGKQVQEVTGASVATKAPSASPKKKVA
jgi:phasin family protein